MNHLFKRNSPDDFRREKRTLWDCGIVDDQPDAFPPSFREHPSPLIVMLKLQPALAALVTLLLFGSTVAQVCGPSACYSSCPGSTQIVDLVFILDVSGSMNVPIKGVVGVSLSSSVISL